jgi:putative phosphoribosyl transferase
MLVQDLPSGDRPQRERDITLSSGRARLAGTLTVPDNAHALVVFTHGSGSSRHSPRGRYVAAILNAAGLGTLLFDLLTPEEERQRSNVFDIGLLAGRLLDVTSELRTMPGIPRLLGYFGASTGAAAALYAAADPAAPVAAIVSRGGRPDLAAPRLAQVRAPTLLIVGGLDHTVIELNRAAQSELRCENQLRIVPGATHLFEEPGTLDAVAYLASNWFTDHLGPAAPPT